LFDYKSKDIENNFTKSQSLGGSNSSNGCHSGPIRGVTISGNDYIMATHSFDCINIWSLDFNASKNTM
jgi:hypothetical protein